LDNMVDIGASTKYLMITQRRWIRPLIWNTYYQKIYTAAHLSILFVNERLLEWKKGTCTKPKRQRPARSTGGRIAGISVHLDAIQASRLPLGMICLVPASA
jgi:hypothetical protein